MTFENKKSPDGFQIPMPLQGEGTLPWHEGKGRFGGMGATPDTIKNRPNGVHMQRMDRPNGGSLRTQKKKPVLGKGGSPSPRTSMSSATKNRLWGVGVVFVENSLDKSPKRTFTEYSFRETFLGNSVMDTLLTNSLGKPSVFSIRCAIKNISAATVQRKTQLKKQLLESLTVRPFKGGGWG